MGSAEESGAAPAPNDASRASNDGEHFVISSAVPFGDRRGGALGIRVMITDVEKTANSSSGRGCQCQRHGRDGPLINKPQ